MIGRGTTRGRRRFMTPRGTPCGRINSRRARISSAIAITCGCWRGSIWVRGPGLGSTRRTWCSRRSWRRIRSAISSGAPTTPSVPAGCGRCCAQRRRRPAGPGSAQAGHQPRAVAGAGAGRVLGPAGGLAGRRGAQPQRIRPAARAGDPCGRRPRAALARAARGAGAPLLAGLLAGRGRQVARADPRRRGRAAQAGTQEPPRAARGDGVTHHMEPIS